MSNESCSCCASSSTVDFKKIKRAHSISKVLLARFVVSGLLFVLGFVLSNNGVSTLLIQSLFIVSWFVAGYRVLWNSLKGIVKGSVFDENFLMSVATLGAFIIGQWSEGAAVMLFYNLGELIQERAVEHSRRSITELIDVRPDTARIADTGRIVHPSGIPLGTLLRILPGEKVPLDGEVVDGKTSFLTAALTGESLPRDVVPGDSAFAGFINGQGVIVIRTSTLYEKTAASRMLELVEHAQEKKAKAEKFITSFARVYTPIVTIAAVLLALCPPLYILLTSVSGSVSLSVFEPWIYRALVFLVISCPCAFVISVPLGYFGGIGGAATLGVLVKGADYLDVLSRARAVVFDKTGTLTKGTLHVSHISHDPLFTTTEFLTLASAAESRSTHPIASAIRTHAATQNNNPDENLIGEYSEYPGLGVHMEYEGSRLFAGKHQFLVQEGILIPDIPQSIVNSTIIEFAQNGQWIGRIAVTDEIKAESKHAVTALRQLGITDIALVSGDSPMVAESVGMEVGISNVYGGVLPHEKVAVFESILEKIHASGKGSVLFVGDGINDAPVLARADAGIAMGGLGSDAAIEAADVVLMQDNPMQVVNAIRSARWTHRIVIQNILLAFGVKIGFLLLGAFGIATLWEAVFADVGVALLATANAVRARHLPASDRTF